MNAIERKNSFIEWLLAGHIQNESTARDYSRMLESVLPDELQRLNENQYGNLFDCIDINYIGSLRARVRVNGDLYAFNLNVLNGGPSAALSQYIVFLNEHIQTDPLPSSAIDLPKNIILYGPPGVGKTYSHKKLISILEDGASLDELKNENYSNSSFDSVKAEGRYWFITFHQSYSYEDFVEGFRPNEEGNIQLESGIFKDISKIAKTNQEASSTKERKKDFEEIFRDLIMGQLADNDRLLIQMKKSRFYITEVTDKSIFFDKDSGESKHSLSIKTLKKMYEFGQNNHIFGGLLSYYDALLEYLLQNSKEVRTDELKNYYLIIDEINRGNISKIFGELITLLEEDKRLGEGNELTVTLPYSKEPFRVPKNLYIVGTMNTADKSIALVDIALRRRFTFVRMDPITEKLPLKIQVINNKILEKKGKSAEDYLIGHAYFIDKDGSMIDETHSKYSFVIKYKIRPLLEEYFYGENIEEIFDGLI